MKLTGYTTGRLPNTEFIDECIGYAQIQEGEYELLVNLDDGDIICDLKEWFDDPNIAGYYGDFFDKNGNYRLQKMFPNPDGKYTGLIMRADLIGSDPAELGKTMIFRYIPKPIFRINK